MHNHMMSCRAGVSCIHLLQHGIQGGIIPLDQRKSSRMLQKQTDFNFIDVQAVRGCGGVEITPLGCVVL